MLERIALARLLPHLTNSTNFSKRQPAYRQGHSTETALLDVFDSDYTAADSKEVTLLIGLDLSAAFDMVSHWILTKRLQSSEWLHFPGSSRIYRTGHSLRSYRKHRSSETAVVFGVRRRYSVRCCSPSIAVKSLASSRPMAGYFPGFWIWGL